MECFTIYSNDIEGRIDPFYLKNILVLEKIKTKFSLVKLGSLLRHDVQYGANESAINGDPEKDVRYIRITDIDEFGNLKNNDWKTSQIIKKKYELNEGDILFARSGATAGKCFYYKNEYGKSIFAGYLIRFVFDEKKVNPKYIFYYSLLNHFKLWIIIIQRPSGQPNINSEEFKSFKIPLPPLSIQNHIVQIMDTAYKLKKQKECEAQQLFDSIDEFVLNKIGIKLPELKDRMTFIVQADDVKGKRIDAYYHHPKFEEVEKAIEKGKYEIKELKEIADKLLSGQRPKGGVRQISEGVPSLGGEHVLDDGSIATTNLKYIPFDFHENKLRNKIYKKDIIIVKDGATTGKVGIVPENYPFEEANINEHVFLLRVKERINHHYIFSFLKSQIGQMQINRDITGGTIMGIIRETTESLKIAIPPLSIQNKIAEEVKRRMQKAEILHKEAKQLLEEAKEKVEKMIENPLEISETQSILRPDIIGTKVEPEIIIPFPTPSKPIIRKLPVKIKHKEYQMLDGSINKLVQQVGDGSIIKRFEKTPIPKSKTDVICPHFLELKWATGCPYDCSWCYLKGTFRFLPYKAKPHIKDFDKIEKHTKTFLEYVQTPEVLNTGELADSLMFEGKNKSFVKFIVPFFENQNNHKILFLTKSNKVENLLLLNSHHQVIVSFSLNAIPVAQRWEKKAPSVEDRIKAAETLYKQGHEVRIRIDPMIPVENWKQLYTDLIDHIFNSFIPERITLGSLRGLQSTINGTSDKSWVKYLSERSNWGRKIDINLRLAMYKTIIYYLNEKYKYDKIALCKETLAIWDILNMDYKNIKCNCIW